MNVQKLTITFYRDRSANSDLGDWSWLQICFSVVEQMKQDAAVVEHAFQTQDLW